MEALYEVPLQRARERFGSRPAVVALLDPRQDEAVLEAFLVFFSAYGVAMTEPVEGWIRRAGERCQQMGLKELGDALVTHAKHEAGHHELMINDTRALSARWNGAKRAPPFDAEALLKRPMPPGVKCYQQLHEDIIASDHPYAQLAIEYEIEALSVNFGPRLIRQCVQRLGKDILKCLSFVPEHVAVDEGHTRFNRLKLEELLLAHPQYAGSLQHAGAQALEAYGDFVQDAMASAKAHVGR